MKTSSYADQYIGQIVSGRKNAIAALPEKSKLDIDLNSLGEVCTEQDKSQVHAKVVVSVRSNPK